MEGRALIFSDPEVVKAVSEQFVAVVADDWVQRRRTDAEGKFFKKVSDQGSRGGDHDETRQGVYLLTAGGTLLSYRNPSGAAAVREMIRRALEKFRALPAAERDVQVPALEPDPDFHRVPPAGGLILRVHTRSLERGGGGAFRAVANLPVGRDHLWLTRAEARSLVPADPKVGSTVEVARPIVMRLARFHLVDNTRGEPPMWERDEVKEAKLTLTVREATEAKVTLALEGRARLAAEGRGYGPELRGTLVFDRAAGAFERVEVTAVGDHWGEGRWTPGARPGRTPLGVAIELVTGRGPTDVIAPQAAREWQGYFDP